MAVKTIQMLARGPSCFAFNARRGALGLGQLGSQGGRALPVLARRFSEKAAAPTSLAPGQCPDYWTGLEPEACPGFEPATATLSSLKPPDLRLAGPLRAALEAYFENGWALTEVLFSGLKDEDVFVRPPAHGLRHAMIFYYGHPAALAINKLRAARRVAGAITEGVVPRWEVLFETGADEMSWDDLDTPQTAWPTVGAVTDYRRRCRDVYLDVVRNHPALDAPLAAGAPTDSNAVVWSFGMICEHERIHLETSTTLIRELPLEASTTTRSGPARGDAGAAPGLPVEINKHEAAAYTAWLASTLGCDLRLPSEAEYARLREVNADAEGAARRSATPPTRRDAAAALDAPELRAKDVNLSLAYGSPSAVDAGAQARLPFPSLAGNCWEYCEDWFAALPGFKASPLYEDFSTPCFDGQHALILGGSFVATGNEASLFSRFHFRPHFHNMIGFRVVRGTTNPELSSHDAPPPWAAGWVPPAYVREKESEEGGHKYESRAQLAAYLDLHHGALAPSTGPRRTWRPTTSATRSTSRGAARTSSSRRRAPRPARCRRRLRRRRSAAMAESGAFGDVVGVDFAQSFVDAAAELNAAGELRYERSGEAGGRGALATAAVASSGALSFRRADACDLPADLGGFDAVLAANLLCRLRTRPRSRPPRRWPREPGGPSTSSAPSLDGGVHARRVVVSPEALEAKMKANGFDLERETPEALVIRDHAAVPFIASHGMLFRKTG
ncbi:hypothetical protein JL720_8497 [Aureococcus anophagefferens]|nr:hypothetical protein JL720_8497 [Aureococcus anophagefferens]